MSSPGSSKLLRIALPVLALLVAMTNCGKPQSTSVADTKGSSKFDDPAVASKVPPQQTYSPAQDPGPPPPFVEMGDPRAKECIVRDVSSTIESGTWRWTNLQPTLQFYLKNPDKQRFAMDFSIIDATFKDTGPVTLSCYINDNLLAKVHCRKPSQYHIEKPVPPAWLQSTNPVIVRATLDKVWTSPSDGTRLGYVLVRAGFKNQ